MHVSLTHFLKVNSNLFIISALELILFSYPCMHCMRHTHKIGASWKAQVLILILSGLNIDFAPSLQSLSFPSPPNHCGVHLVRTLGYSLLLLTIPWLLMCMVLWGVKVKRNPVEKGDKSTSNESVWNLTGYPRMGWCWHWVNNIEYIYIYIKSFCSIVPSWTHKCSHTWKNGILHWYSSPFTIGTLPSVHVQAKQRLGLVIPTSIYQADFQESISVYLESAEYMFTAVVMGIPGKLPTNSLTN